MASVLDLDSDTTVLESWQLNEAEMGEMTWRRGGVDEVIIRDQEGVTSAHEISEEQNAALRAICVEALQHPERHSWLQLEVGRFIGTAAAQIIAATSGDKLSAIQRFASALK